MTALNFVKYIFGLKLLKVDLIIWDEVPMQDRFCQEAVDLTLKDIRNSNHPFGGVTVVFGGDFQQILPVVPKGGREQTVGQSIQRSRLWTHIQVLHLKQNMRLDSATEEERQFAQWLLDVGHGQPTVTDADGSITLPQNMKCGANSEHLINSVYPGISVLNTSDDNDAYFLERTILTGRNDDMEEMNKEILDRIPGESRIYRSADTVVTEQGADGEFNYPTEYLNSINVSGMPPSKLELKIGVPIMVLRNIDPAQGLCNGTRAVVTQFSSKVLEVRILGGDFAGKTAFIPRIKLISSSVDLPFKLCRTQFPVRVAMVMTINKSQGQSVKNVGLDLRTAVFTHGQLYVALSRCTSSNRIKVLFPDGSDNTVTKNIVYPEILID